MKRILIGIMFALLSANALANSIIIPDPKVLKNRTNAITVIAFPLPIKAAHKNIENDIWYNFELGFFKKVR